MIIYNAYSQNTIRDEILHQPYKTHLQVYSCCQGQNPDGGLPDGDFMSEAKDWAGELISGQTGTGRILVNLIVMVLVMVTGAGSIQSFLFSLLIWYWTVTMFDMF